MIFKLNFNIPTFKIIYVLVAFLATIKAICKNMICPVLVLLSFSVEAETINKAEVQGQFVHLPLVGNKLISEYVDIDLPVNANGVAINKSVSKYSRGTSKPISPIVSANEKSNKAGANNSARDRIKVGNNGADNTLHVIFMLVIATFMMIYGNDESKT